MIYQVGRGRRKGDKCDKGDISFIANATAALMAVLGMESCRFGHVFSVFLYRIAQHEPCSDQLDGIVTQKEDSC